MQFETDQLMQYNHFNWFRQGPLRSLFKHLFYQARPVPLIRHFHFEMSFVYENTELNFKPSVCGSARLLPHPVKLIPGRGQVVD